MAKPIALSASPKWPDVKDDYVVRYDGHLIGRMRLGGYSHHVGVEHRRSHGNAGMGERKRRKPRCVHEQFTAACGRFLKETSAERLDRAWELERAFAAHYRRMGMGKTDVT
jgi:hypothetical protein